MSDFISTIRSFFGGRQLPELGRQKRSCVNCYYWTISRCECVLRIPSILFYQDPRWTAYEEPLALPAWAAWCEHHCREFIQSRGQARAAPPQGTGEFDASLDVDIDAFYQMTSEEQRIYTNNLVRRREAAHNATLGQAPTDATISFKSSTRPVIFSREATPAKAAEAEEPPARRPRKYDI